MTNKDDPEAFINSFEKWTTQAASWPVDQWVAIQYLSLNWWCWPQAIDTLTPEEVPKFGKLRVRYAILQMLNLSPEAYQGRLREIAFSPDYHPCFVAQKVRAEGLWWLHLVVQTAMQVAETILIECYVAILPFKPKNWVMCLAHLCLGRGCGPFNS